MPTGGIDHVGECGIGVGDLPVDEPATGDHAVGDVILDLIVVGTLTPDHLLPASARGPTDVCNGGPRCGCHNRWRQRAGASSTLDDEGRWVTQLPDGTDIAPPDDIDFH
mgnify:CR=1 FL=1